METFFKIEFKTINGATLYYISGEDTTEDNYMESLKNIKVSVNFSSINNKEDINENLL